jgi:hypothetical protein
MFIFQGVLGLMMHRSVGATIVGLFVFALQIVSGNRVWGGEAQKRADTDWEAVVKAEQTKGSNKQRSRVFGCE